MNTEDLKKILHVANSENLQSSAKSLNMTPGALSKTLKRVESTLGKLLFSRQGKTIKLNQQGKIFLASGAKLIQEFEQFTSQFSSSMALPELRVSAPAILSSYLGPRLAECLPTPQPIKFQSQYEDSAAQQVLSGVADIALISEDVKSRLPNDVRCLFLSNFNFKLACGNELFNQLSHSLPLTNPTIQALPFAIPAVSPFCGRDSQQSTDSWPDHIISRNIWFICEDYLSLIKLVKESKCVAYLPEFIIQQEQLAPLAVEAISEHHKEKIYMMWRPSRSEGWLNNFVYSVEKQFNKIE